MMSKKTFDELDATILKEYLAKNYSPAQAAYIARATAGKIAREKRAKAKKR